jgi:hypothetical protein
VNALANDKVAEYLNEHFVATYLKVGTFRIVNGQKQGGNVASYFCLPDGAVVHALAGKVDANELLREARWALETRKAALTLSTKFATGDVNLEKFASHIRKAHEERLRDETGYRPPILAKQPKGKQSVALPQRVRELPRAGQVYWLLANQPLVPIEEVYPIVWEQVLGEKLSGLPVAQR